MEIVRCNWCEKDDLYRNYHDDEWGKPVYDDSVFFEFMILESFQAGLSWYTILKKRENFKTAFDQFNYKIISKYSNEKVSELMEDKGIIRNRLKILAAVNNANKFIEVQNEFGSFSNYLWQFVNNMPIVNTIDHINDLPSKTSLSDDIAKDLKNRGFKFLGSTVVYAYLQATGLINDHVEECSFK